MRFLSGILLVAFLCGCDKDAARTTGVRLLPNKTQIYVSSDACAVTRFAAGELQKFLSQSLDSVIPVTNVFLEGYAALCVGDNAEARAAGVDVSALPRDAGIIRTSGTRVFIAGFDDATRTAKDIAAAFKAGIWANMYERGSEFAVYEFLEKFVGVRFYFPGELGTIVPRHAFLDIPETNRVDAPDCSHRDYAAWEMGAWFDEEHAKDGRQIMHHRHRLQTGFIPCSHGLNEFWYPERFGKTHPEYFQMTADGKRNCEPSSRHRGQLCHTSKVWDEIYEDVKSYFLGESADKRGVPALTWPPGRGKYDWNCNTRELKGLGKFADVMPQDGFQDCHCTNCVAAYRREKGNSYATDLIWGNVAKLCNRLKAEGIQGVVTMMGYVPYLNPPEFPLPDNLRVMVARHGPWNEANPEALKKELEVIRTWKNKIGHKVWLWNYPCKFRGEFPAIPEHCPRAWAKYYQSLSDDIFGCFAQNTTTRWMYGHLNTYVLGKVLWNMKTDVDALLDEYYSLMYGAGKKEMKLFFEAMERIWMGRVVGKTVETPLGPVVTQPSDYEMFTSIYSREIIKDLDGLLKKATAKVGEGTLEARRIALMRREYFTPLAERSEKYHAATDVRRGLAQKASRKSLPNVIANGDFDHDLSSWQGKGVIDTSTKVTGEGSVKIVVTDPRGGTVYQMLNKGARRLKPKTKYRLSYFIRYENIIPSKKGGGGYSNVWTEGQNWYPVNHCGHTGSAGWIYQEQEFVSRPERGEYGGYDACSISLGLRDATGTVWFDDVKLEEVQGQ